MSAASPWSADDELEFMKSALRKYVPDIETLELHTHQAHLYDDRSNSLAKGPLFIVRRHHRHHYYLILMNKGAKKFESGNNPINVWEATLKVTLDARAEMQDHYFLGRCAKNHKDFAIYFSEPDDVQKIQTFVDNFTSQCSRGTLSFLADSDDSQLTSNQEAQNIKSELVVPPIKWKLDLNFAIPDLLSSKNSFVHVSQPTSVSHKTKGKSKRY